MIAFASSLDQAGPLTRDVSDAALMLRHMSGRDACDATSLHSASVEPPSARRLDGLRLGVPEELAGEGIEAGVIECCRSKLSLAEGLGADVAEVRRPHAQPVQAAYIWTTPDH